MDKKRECSGLSEKNIFLLERKLERIYRNRSKKFSFGTQRKIKDTEETPPVPSNSPADSKDSESPPSDNRAIEEASLKKVTSSVDIVDMSQLHNSQENCLSLRANTATNNKHQGD